ncbi:hypothetical protein [Microcystis phage Mae-JY09]
MTTRPMPREHTAPVTQWWNEPTSAEHAYERAVARQQASGLDFIAHMERRWAAEDAAADAARAARRERERAERAMGRMHGAFCWLVGSCIGGALVVAVNFIIFGGINP